MENQQQGVLMENFRTKENISLQDDEVYGNRYPLMKDTCGGYSSDSQSQESDDVISQINTNGNELNFITDEDDNRNRDEDSGGDKINEVFNFNVRFNFDGSDPFNSSESDPSLSAPISHNAPSCSMPFFKCVDSNASNMCTINKSDFEVNSCENVNIIAPEARNNNTSDALNHVSVNNSSIIKNPLHAFDLGKQKSDVSDFKQNVCGSKMEANNNPTVNEFRDTIGFCQISDTNHPINYSNDVDSERIDIYRYFNGNDGCMEKSAKELKNSSPSHQSFVSLNTQIMDILTDLDDLLDKSLARDDTEKYFSEIPENENNRPDIKENSITQLLDNNQSNHNEISSLLPKLVDISEMDYLRNQDEDEDSYVTKCFDFLEPISFDNNQDLLIDKSNQEDKSYARVNIDPVEINGIEVLESPNDFKPSDNFILPVSLSNLDIAKGVAQLTDKRMNCIILPDLIEDLRIKPYNECDIISENIVLLSNGKKDLPMIQPTEGCSMDLDYMNNPASGFSSKSDDADQNICRNKSQIESKKCDHNETVGIVNLLPESEKFIMNKDAEENLIERGVHSTSNVVPQLEQEEKRINYCELETVNHVSEELNNSENKKIMNCKVMTENNQSLADGKQNMRRDPGQNTSQIHEDETQSTSDKDRIIASSSKEQRMYHFKNPEASTSQREFDMEKNHSSSRDVRRDPDQLKSELAHTEAAESTSASRYASRQLEERQRNHRNVEQEQQGEAVIGLASSMSDVAASRGSMRLLRPLPLPSAPPLAHADPPELTLPALLFMEAQDSAGYSPARLRDLQRPVSADGPREFGRRGMGSGRRSAPAQVSGEVTACRGWRSSGRSSTSSRNRRARSPGSVSSDSSSVSSNEADSPTNRCDPSHRDDLPGSGGAAGDGAGAGSPLGVWPHGLSSMLASLGCTLGIFNINRFAIFSIHFGANFIVQFLILSLVVGIPLFSLFTCLGQLLCAGPLDMWKISPLFQGVGIALLLAQAAMGVYSIIGISWLFVYFRDSFITKLDRYRWAEPFALFREDINIVHNGTYKLSETVPDYFNGVVLQRHNLAAPESSFGSVKFQLTFNLAVIWMIVFVSLSKGLRSYGKVAYMFSFVPICGTLVLCAKLLSLTPHDSMYDVFPETSWNEFFINSKSWGAAAQEVFLTWGLLGACAMQLASHNARLGSARRRASALRRDATLAAALTLAVLLLAAFLANTCLHIITHHGYAYVPGSFEKMSSYTFLRQEHGISLPSLSSLPVRYMSHHACLLGTHVSRPGVDVSTQSGYQVLQLATELVPSTLAIVGPDKLSSFWAVLFYFILIMFGVAQQLAIWHCVITGLLAINVSTMRAWESSITFFSCVCGFLLGLPMTTDAGILVVHFIDYVCVGMWWQGALQVLLLLGVFLVRGRPCTGEAVVGELCPAPSPGARASSPAALLSFLWNVIMPVALVAMCIIDFRLGKYRQLYSWKRMGPGYEYWPLWCKKLGATMQLVPLLAVPVTGLIQTWRYMNSGPPDILDRIQLLYRPVMDDPRTVSAPRSDSPPPRSPETNLTEGVGSVVATPPPDPPPKYTPPPSYSTATGARIAKMLRHSIRRSIRGVRRLAISFGESSTNPSQIPMSISESVGQSRHPSTERPPPNYSIFMIDAVPPVTTTVNQLQNTETTLSSVASNSRLSRAYQSFNGNFLRTKVDTKSTTAIDVANLLRTSIRRSTRVRTLPSTLDFSNISQENLLVQAEPISNTSVRFLNERNAEESRSEEEAGDTRNRNNVIDESTAI